MEQENWIVSLISSSPILAFGFGIGAGILGFLWYLGGHQQEKDEADNYDELDETLDFSTIDDQIEFHKQEALKLEAKRAAHLSNEQMLNEMREILAQMKTTMKGVENETIEPS